MKRITYALIIIGILITLSGVIYSQTGQSTFCNDPAMGCDSAMLDQQATDNTNAANRAVTLMGVGCIITTIGVVKLIK